MESLQGFKESLKLDAECATTISGSMETTAVEKFVNTLENCEGRVLVSGIGRYHGLKLTLFILDSSISSKLFFLEVQ